MYDPEQDIPTINESPNHKQQASDENCYRDAYSRDNASVLLRSPNDLSGVNGTTGAVPQLEIVGTANDKLTEGRSTPDELGHAEKRLSLERTAVNVQRRLTYQELQIPANGSFVSEVPGGGVLSRDRAGNMTLSFQNGRNREHIQIGSNGSISTFQNGHPSTAFQFQQVGQSLFIVTPDGHRVQLQNGQLVSSQTGNVFAQIIPVRQTRPIMHK